MVWQSDFILVQNMDLDFICIVVLTMDIKQIHRSIYISAINLQFCHTYIYLYIPNEPSAERKYMQRKWQEMSPPPQDDGTGTQTGAHPDPHTMLEWLQLCIILYG